MNNVNIIGRCAQSPLKIPTKITERYVCKFALAFDTRIKKEDGTKETSFIDCEAWDMLATRIYENVQAGDRIGITGYLQQARFIRKDGSKGSCIKIVVTSIEYLEKKRVVEAPEDALPVTEEISVVDEIKDEELPF